MRGGNGSVSAAASTAAAEPAATQLRRVVCLGGWGRGMVASLDFYTYIEI